MHNASQEKRSMDDQIYQHWWQLHVRVARGEKLSPLEQMEYDRGLQVLDREERQELEAGDRAGLRKLRAQIEQLQTENVQLRARSARLDRQIRTLERAYGKLTGYELASDAYAAS
jgi:predicted RNase H-like nuclease (RuvC/YqgF family)